MKSFLEKKLVLHGTKLSEVKRLVFVDFYEIHQDHVDRVVVNSRINYFHPNPEDYITGVLIWKFLLIYLLRYNFFRQT